MRKDSVSSRARAQYRVYLDNFDLVERLDRQTAQALVLRKWCNTFVDGLELRPTQAEQGRLVLPASADVGETGCVHVEGAASRLWGLRLLCALLETVVGHFE